MKCSIYSYTNTHVTIISVVIWNNQSLGMMWGLLPSFKLCPCLLVNWWVTFSIVLWCEYLVNTKLLDFLFFLLPQICFWLLCTNKIWTLAAHFIVLPCLVCQSFSKWVTWASHCSLVWYNKKQWEPTHTYTALYWPLLGDYYIRMVIAVHIHVVKRCLYLGWRWLYDVWSEKQSRGAGRSPRLW